VRTSFTPWVPFRIVRFESAIPREAASTSEGRMSMSRLAAMSSWLPSRSEVARARFASASPSAVARSASAAASARTSVAAAATSARTRAAVASDSASVVLR
jgi:hypothetical protein